MFFGKPHSIFIDMTRPCTTFFLLFRFLAAACARDQALILFDLSGSVRLIFSEGEGPFAHLNSSYEELPAHIQQIATADE